MVWSLVLEIPSIATTGDFEWFIILRMDSCKEPRWDEWFEESRSTTGELEVQTEKFSSSPEFEYSEIQETARMKYSDVDECVQDEPFDDIDLY